MNAKRKAFERLSPDDRWVLVCGLHERIRKLTANVEALKDEIEEHEDRGDAAWQMEVHAVADEVVKRMVDE